MKYLVCFFLSFQAFFGNSQDLTNEELKQLYSSEELEFHANQSPYEKKFIHFLRTRKIDSCLASISPQLILEYGKMRLSDTLKAISSYFKQYGEPIYNWKLCKTSILRGTDFSVGCYGHNLKGTIEKQSIYLFENKDGKPAFQLSLFYWNSPNYGDIKFISFLDGSDMIQEISN